MMTVFLQFYRVPEKRYLLLCSFHLFTLKHFFKFQVGIDTSECIICLQYNYLIITLEALRERRPPWPRQIITLISPTVKMLILGCERQPCGINDLPRPRRSALSECFYSFCVFLFIKNM